MAEGKKNRKVGKSKRTPDADAVVVAYKGFDRNLRCRDFQYEVGKTYTHKGCVSLCAGGFHACEHPLSVWCFYTITNGTRFAVVEQSGDIAKDGNKQASRTITIKAEVGIPGLVKAAVEWTHKAAATPTSGYSAHSATSGNYAHSATSGDCANSATSGDYANSATSGDYAHSATSGDCANSATSGYSTQAESAGKNAVAAIAGSGIARAGRGGAIFLVERGIHLEILSVFASKVGENGIKADTWYTLKCGKPVEVTP